MGPKRQKLPCVRRTSEGELKGNKQCSRKEEVGIGEGTGDSVRSAVWVWVSVCEAV